MKARRFRPLCFVLSLLLVGLMPATTLQATEPAATTRRMALGVSMLPDRSLDTVDQFTASVGRAPAIWSIWSPWAGASSAFPDPAFLGALRDRGATPLIWWYPQDPADQGSSAYTYRRIAAGRHDAYIRAYAEAAAAYGGPILLRFAHEHNGRWFSWSIGQFDNTPARFIRAWRHIWRIFKGAGATNVRFVWSPNNPCGRCSPFRVSYPGNAYVDYVGFTSFNWGGARWRSMVQTFAPSMKALAKVTRKPVIVTEMGSAPKGGDKVAWIRKGYPAAFRKFPRIEAIVYFNVDSRSLANQPDWRLDTPPRGLAVYRELLERPSFQGRLR